LSVILRCPTTDVSQQRGLFGGRRQIIDLAIDQARRDNLSSQIDVLFLRNVRLRSR
jgi:hypothetical protein